MRPTDDLPRADTRPAPSTPAPSSSTVRAPLAPFDLPRSFVLQRFGRSDPTATMSSLRFEKTYMAGGHAAHVTLEHAAPEVMVRVEGVDAAARAEVWREALAPGDGHDAFAPDDPLLRRLHRQQPGLRLVRVPWLWDISCSCILQQRVAYPDAVLAWHRLAKAFGARVGERVAFPDAATVARLSTWEIQQHGVDLKRAQALVALGREERFRPFLDTPTPLAVGALRARLARVAGVGPWTTEMILGFGAGDPDALPTGDLHLPHVVCWALARESPGTDARMLALLEPYRGHRFRVGRLLVGAKIKPPPRPRARAARG